MLEANRDKLYSQVCCTTALVPHKHMPACLAIYVAMLKQLCSKEIIHFHRAFLCIGQSLIELCDFVLIAFLFLSMGFMT